MNPRHTEPFHPESGVAFIYVMLIFIAASVIIGGLLSTGYREVDRTGRFLNEMQVTQYALGAEMFARQQLLESEGQKLWTGSQSPFLFPEGSVTMEIEDLHGRFNINSLLTNDGQAVTHFKALCASLGLTEKTVADALVQFSALKPPPPVPGVAPVLPAWLADASELADNILPMSDYLKLAPYIVALPDGEYTVNINTASDPVLLAYLEKPEQLDMVHATIKANGSIPADQMSQFQNHDNSLSLDSSSFRLRVAVTMNGQPPVYLSSVLMRLTDQKRVAAIARSWGG